MNTKLTKVVFLDRDGVINRDSDDYIKSWSEFEFLPGSPEAIRLLTQKGFDVILITNQSAVNRKLITLKTLQDIHHRMKAALEAEGGRIRDIFFCPHTPEEACDCRKPKPGLILRAHQTYHIDLSSAVMVGDNAKDVECARNAGCGRSVLVKTGNALQAETELARKNIAPDHVARDLLAAAQWIIAHEKRSCPAPHRA